MNKLTKALCIIIGVAAAISFVASIILAIKYWNTPAGEIPWWVWWLWRN